MLDCRYHLQLRISDRAFPSVSDLEEGDHVARFRGAVVALFRQQVADLEVGSPLALTIEHCVRQEHFGRFAMIGGFTVMSDPLEEIEVLEVVLNSRLQVPCGLVLPLQAPTDHPQIQGPGLDWMAHS